MPTQRMTKVKKSDNRVKGGVYSESLSRTDNSDDNNIFLLPTDEIYSITARQNGGVLWFTFDTEKPRTWEAWDGSSAIDLGAMAFKFVWTSGTATATVTVKTAKG